MPTQPCGGHAAFRYTWPGKAIWPTYLLQERTVNWFKYDKSREAPIEIFIFVGVYTAIVITLTLYFNKFLP